LVDRHRKAYANDISENSQLIVMKNPHNILILVVIINVMTATIHLNPAKAQTSGIMMMLGLYSALKTVPLTKDPLPGALKEIKSENISLAKEIFSELIKKNDEDLISLSVMSNPCTEIGCRGLARESVLRLISSALLQKQAQSDAVTRQQQALAAIFSACIAFSSLLISIISLLVSYKAYKKK
jgi:hypothetical protein